MIKNSITLKTECFDIGQVLTCGQCFRFEKTSENEYSIIAFSKKLNIIQNSNEVVLYPVQGGEFDSLWKNYFDLGTDYPRIQNILASNDSVMSDAIGYAPGIRILNQEPWECLISFIISQNNNIPRIKSIVEKISRRFGTEIDTGVSGTLFAFPTVEQLSRASIDSLKECGVGFRAKYIADAVKRVYSGEINLDGLNKLPSEGLRKKLMEIYGVGQKVSDCVMLFSYGRRELFPVDVWIKRIIEHFYFNKQDTPISDIHKFAGEKFGAYGGYAQQYLFHYARQYGGFSR